MKPENSVYRIPLKRKDIHAPRTRGGLKPDTWKPSIRSDHRVPAKRSWWTDHAAPESRETFIVAAREREIDREHRRNLAESQKQFGPLGIGMWRR